MDSVLVDIDVACVLLDGIGSAASGVVDAVACCCPYKSH